MDKKEHFITLSHSKELYGIAILLMICHHMFGFPDKISAAYTVFLMHKGIPVITILAGGCKICVAMYAFLSGYGMISKIAMKNPLIVIKTGYQAAFRHLKKFYMVYWLVFVIFIGYGFAAGILKFHVKEFLYNLAGIRYSYNGEWWYVWQYVRMLILFPLFACFIVCLPGKHKKRIMYFWMLLLIILEAAAISLIKGNVFWTYTFCFLNGMIISYGKLDTELHRLEKHPMVAVAAGGILAGFAFIARLTVAGSGQYDFIVGPVFIYGCLLLLYGGWAYLIKKILITIGKYSVYMWLIHTFFIYYYFQKFVFMGRYAIIVYITTVVIVMLISVLLDVVARFVIVNTQKY